MQFYDDDMQLWYDTNTRPRDASIETLEKTHQSVKRLEQDILEFIQKKRSTDVVQ